jgi:Cu(I)/Ag(I) efflux system protein CusF
MDSKEIMVKFLLKLIVLLSFAGIAFAQTHQATGVVKGVKADKGLVTLKHDPIKSLNWPGMTMDFNVRDKKLLAGLKPEQKVTFEFVQEKSGSVITAIK